MENIMFILLVISAIANVALILQYLSLRSYAKLLKTINMSLTRVIVDCKSKLCIDMSCQSRKTPYG